MFFIFVNFSGEFDFILLIVSIAEFSVPLTPFDTLSKFTLSITESDKSLEVDSSTGKFDDDNVSLVTAPIEEAFVVPPIIFAILVLSFSVEVVDIGTLLVLIVLVVFFVTVLVFEL